MSKGDEHEQRQKVHGIALFILATLSSLPFVIVVGLTMATKYIMSGPLVPSVFLLPLFVLLTIAAPVFIYKSWKQSHPNCIPFLIIYTVSIPVYWLMLLSMDTF